MLMENPGQIHLKLQGGIARSLSRTTVMFSGRTAAVLPRFDSGRIFEV